MAEPLMSEAEFADWAARQSLRFALVEGRLTRLPDDQQSDVRLAVAGAIAAEVLGSDEVARAWLATPAQEFGGRSPAQLATEGGEASQIVLRSLVRRHRRALAAERG